MTTTTPYTVHKAGRDRYEIRTEYGDCYKSFVKLADAREVCTAMNAADARHGAQLVHHLVEAGIAAAAEADDCTDCDGTGQVSVWYGSDSVVIEPCSCTAGIAIRAIS